MGGGSLGLRKKDILDINNHVGMKGKVEKEKFHLIQQLKRVKYGMERDNVCLKTDE